MEHLPRPSNSDPPPIEIPLFCTDPDNQYDNLDYMTFPERRGLRTASGRGSSRYLLIRELGDREWYSTLEVLQEWLYFGLLRVVFDGALQRGDFIRMKSVDRSTICSDKLLAMMQ